MPKNANIAIFVHYGKTRIMLKRQGTSSVKLSYTHTKSCVSKGLFTGTKANNKRISRYFESRRKYERKGIVHT